MQKPLNLKLVTPLVLLGVFVFSSNLLLSINLLNNPDFESGTINLSYGDGSWAYMGAPDIVVQDAEVYSGGHAVAITGRTATWNGIRYNFENLVVGKVYNVTFFAKTVTPNSVVRVLIKKVSGSTVSYQQVAQEIVSNDGWTKIQGSFISDGTEDFFYTAGDLTDLYLDHFSLVEILGLDSIGFLNSGNDSWEIDFQDPYTKIKFFNPIESFELIEKSEDMVTWIPVARNYSNSWESTFPYAYDIAQLSGEVEMSIPYNSETFFRKSSNSTIEPKTNRELAAKFLIQSTFGPKLYSIDAFPNLDSQQEIGIADYEQWITEQKNIDPFYHRKFWRERSDPDFTDGTSSYLENEVKHKDTLGQRYNFYRNNVPYQTNWNNRLPGYGGYYDSSGVLIDYLPYTEDANGNGVLDPGEDIGHLNSSGNTVGANNGQLDDNIQGQGTAGSPYIPRIGQHVSNALAAGNSIWDVSMPVNQTKKAVWYKAAITADDQLRQRVAWALSQYFVVGETGSNQLQLTERWLNYYDIFVRHAFGNFKDILSEVTWSPHMGRYLSHLNNRGDRIAQGIYPDENYAREVMQLFTIGLWELNEDGSLEIGSNGQAIPTYDNDDITEFAKVFTGLRLAYDRTNIETSFGNYIDPMRVQSDWHEFSNKTLLDGTQLGVFPQTEQGVTNEIEALLTHLFNHKNMPPFFAKFLIQRFTISNPSPNYIKDVATAFKTGYYDDTGTGARGDMLATIRAVLLHPEARENILSNDTNHGKLREPLIRVIHLIRALNISSNRTYGWYQLNALEDTILQAPYDSPSVFNFYRPDYQPNGEILQKNLNAPEFQINNDVSSLQLFNIYQTLTMHGIAGNSYGTIGSKWYIEGSAELSYETSYLTNNLDDLVNHYDLLLTGGRLNQTTKQIIQNFIISNPQLGNLDKVKYVAYLTTLAKEYNTIY